MKSKKRENLDLGRLKNEFLSFLLPALFNGIPFSKEPIYILLPKKKHQAKQNKTKTNQEEGVLLFVYLFRKGKTCDMWVKEIWGHCQRWIRESHIKIKKQLANVKRLFVSLSFFFFPDPYWGANQENDRFGRKYKRVDVICNGGENWKTEREEKKV